MGAGASAPKVVKKAKSTDKGRKTLFKKLDINNDGYLTLMEVYDSLSKMGAEGRKLQDHWSAEAIKAIIAKHDIDSDGMLTEEEFTGVLDDLTATGKRRKDKKSATETEEEAAPEPELKRSNSAAWKLDDDVKEKEEKEDLEKVFWTKQEAMGTWKVPIGGDLARMPWLSKGETGITAAIKRAQSLGKTPLLVDNTDDKTVDSFYAKKPNTVLLEATLMLADEKKQVRTHAKVMKDARELLVEAMKDGKTFYVRLKGEVTEFLNGNYTGADTLPVEVFSQKFINQLADYTGEAEDPHVGSLTDSDHPFAKVLRPKELDMKNNFTIKPGFEVVVCTWLPVSSFNEQLRCSLPLHGMQAILPMATLILGAE